MSVMGQTVSHTPCSFVDVVGLLDTALQLHDIKCFKAAALHFIVCGEMLFTMLRRFLAAETCAEKLCIGGQVWVWCVQVCQRALCVSFGCQRAVCVFVVCQRALFVSFVCQRAVCVSFVSQRCLCFISVFNSLFVHSHIESFLHWVLHRRSDYFDGLVAVYMGGYGYCDHPFT